MPEEPTYTATCHTEDCGNADQPVAMAYDPETGPPGAVICGVCGQPITDLAGMPG